ncbi:hypothetical protein HYALB_00001982 [Hymenoscyphus albidus]|uniref:Uncharacterized protein n=1 Tax=Hymenoscyphus albidus TaxID=595503 RepID=A0A9N9LAX2_9HELO|nr:hypothetical protein HYALB_00001982 [Hymenoscyphus albidus]
MSISRAFLLFSVGVSVVAANAIPADAQITPAPLYNRQAVSQRLIGYYSTLGAGTWDSAGCPLSSTWTTSGSYGKCCSSGSICAGSDYATRCSGDYVYFGGSSLSCTYTCNTDYVFASTLDSSPQRWVGCASSSSSTSFYRGVAATVTASRATDTGFLVRPTVTVPGSNPTFTPPASKKKASKIWIVGVVIGVVALLAIIGIVAFILISRKKKKARAAAIASGQAPAYGPPGQPQMQQKYMQPPPGQVGMIPMVQQQHYPPPQENLYHAPMQDGKPGVYPVGGPPQSPPPPQWTPQQNTPSSTIPVSPITQRGSVTPSEGAALQDQRAMNSKSPVGTISEIGSQPLNPTTPPPNNLGASPNALGASPNIVSPQQTGNTMSSVSAMSTPPPQQTHVASQPTQIQPGHHARGPVSELQ